MSTAETTFLRSLPHRRVRVISVRVWQCRDAGWCTIEATPMGWAIDITDKGREALAAQSPAVP